MPLSRPLAQYFLQNYLNSTADYSNPLIALINANIAGLQPAKVITDDIDPLHDVGRDYAAKLQAAGISARYQNYSGVTHEFFGLGLVVSQGTDAVNFAAGLRSAFS